MISVPIVTRIYDFQSSSKPVEISQKDMCAAEIEKLRAENANLTTENAQLTAQLSFLGLEKCGDRTSNPDYAKCEEHMKADYTSCITLCPPGDSTCLAACVGQYNENLKNCPCNENCPLGCPCPNYTCASSTTTTQSRLQSKAIFLPIWTISVTMS